MIKHAYPRRKSPTWGVPTFFLGFALLSVILTGCDVLSAGGSGNKASIDPLETDRLVGAHYYPWYEAHQGHQNWTQDAVSDPVLGEYASATDSVINRHVKWAREHGIQWFSMSWWGPNAPTDRVIKNHFLDARLADSIKFSILYETVGRFESGRVDMSEESNQQRLAEDLEYLSDSYFDRENYLQIDGQPVLFVYIGHGYYGDVKAAFQNAFQQAGVDPYILADISFGSLLEGRPIAGVADGITAYNPYSPSENIEDVFHDRFDVGNRRFAETARQSAVDFIPVTIAGYNDTEIPDSQREDNPILEASPQRFRRVTSQVQPYLDEAPAVLITSFNEWYENTQIEPNKEVGTSYLEIVADSLATK